MQFRNHLYDIEYKPVFRFDTRVISVGNLSMGGTGKTPFVEYLLRFLISKNYENKISTLSRGYGRKTSGFRIANKNDDPKSIGDEPFQIYKKFENKAHVTVGEDRVLAIPSILQDFPENEIIILDDAFQHRSVKPNLSILLTDYSSLFYKDYVLPSGTLREGRSGVKRAEVVVVTKCPKDISLKEKNEIRVKINSYTKNEVFFTSINYERPIPSVGDKGLGNKVILVTGIAHAHHFKEFLLREGVEILRHFDFADHHHFSVKEIQEIESLAEQENATIITTEKDWVRLISMPELSTSFRTRLFYVPIMVQFLDDEESFHRILEDSILSTI